MRIEIAVDARDGVGEGPFWDEVEGELWWVDISGKRLHRWQPATGKRQDWQLDDFPSAVVLREAGGLLLAMRDGLYFMDPETGERQRFVAHEPDRPENRTNDAKCAPDGSFWVGTMQNNLNPDGSAKAMTGNTGALYRVRHDGGITREVDGVGLSNTLAWRDEGRTLLFADTATGIIRAFEVKADGRLGVSCVFNNNTFDGTDGGEKLPGYCDGSAIDAEGYLWNARFAGSCLIRFKPDGTVDRKIDLPVSQPTSCCFGGPELTMLYVTSARHGLDEAAIAKNPNEGAVLAIETGVKGTPSVRFAG
jgi:sugar lactone lactonase YvrE